MTNIRRARRPLIRLEKLDDRLNPVTFQVKSTTYTDPNGLKAALVAVNASADASNTITFLPGLTGSITLTADMEKIVKSVDIQGPGANLLTIDGNTTKRLFNIDDAAAGNLLTVNVSGLTIANGLSPDNGGGVRSVENTTLRDVIVRGNKSTGDGGGVWAGGGTLKLLNAVVGTPASPNKAPDGAGIRNTGATFTITGSRIEANVASNGGGTGGYYQSAGALDSMENTTVAANVGGLGGGFYLTGGQVNISNSLFTGNQATNTAASVGGAIDVAGAAVVIRNTTIAGNTAKADGGGIFFGSGSLEVRNSTIAFNTATTGSGGGLKATPATAKLYSTIVAKNTAAANPDVSATVDTDSGFNLIENGTGLTGITNATKGNIVGQNPGFAAAGLAFNGGGVQTIAITAASQAKDAGDTTGLGLTTDGRGAQFARVVGTKADIGAYELPAAAVGLQVTTAADEDDPTYDPASTSLREAVKFAGTDAPAITFAAALNGQTLTLTRGKLLIDRAVSIQGPGADKLTVSGGGQYRIATVSDGNDANILSVSVSGLTFTNGKADPATNGGESFGGALFNRENLTLDQMVITGNASLSDSGAIEHRIGNLTVTNSSVTNNTAAAAGGGIYNFSGGTVAVRSSLIAGNKATGGSGGGLFNAPTGTGVMVVSDSTVSGNTAKANGGGIFNSSGTLIVNNSTVALNVAGADNTAVGKGGGVFVTAATTAKMTGTIVAKNTVGTFAGSEGPDIHGLLVGKFSLVLVTDKWDQTGSSNNKLNVDPNLGPLANNGGPTLTHALPATGPATDPGFTDADINPDALTTDQRGVARKTGTSIDIGAFEFAPNTPPTVSTITNPPAGPLGSAIGPVSFTVGDTETVAGSLTVTATSSNATLFPASGIATGGTGANRTVTLTPAAGQSGTSTITVTVSDGTASTSTTFTATVNNVQNTPPTVTAIGNPAAISANNVFPLINFTVGDAETTPGSLTVTATSSNATLIPNNAANLTPGGTGANRTLLVSPAPGQSGTSTITVTVSDGTASTSTTFTATVNPVGTGAAPTISTISNPAAVTPGTAVGPIGFTVADADTAVGSLTVTATSGNTTLIPASGVTLGGSGANRTITLTPAAGQTGTSLVTVTVSDGTTSTSTTFTATVSATGATNRTLLYGTPQFGVGLGSGTAATVQYYNPDKSQRFNTTAFSGFTGGVRTATGDFNADGVPDLVVGTGPGQATQVRILDGTNQTQIFSVSPFEGSFTGGVYVAVGDVNGDGKADLIITPDEGGGPRVDIYSGATGNAKLASFFGIDDSNFRGGARAAVADFNADGTGDVVVAAGFGGGPRVAVFDGKTVATTRTRLFGDFFVFEEALRNGAFVAAGDFDGDGKADLVAGGGPGGGPRVTIFTGANLLNNQYVPLANFFAGDTSNRGGIRVAVKDLDADTKADLVVGSGTGGGSRVTGFAGKAISNAPPELFAFDAQGGFTGGVFVG